MSYSHTDPDIPKQRVSAFLAKGLSGCGIETLRVIQTYQVNNPEYGYTEEQAKETYWKALHRLKELRTANIPTGVIISPEGHRSDDGQLKKGETGIVAAGRLLAPVIYVPMAIVYEGEYGREKMNFGKKVEIKIGEVTIQEDAKTYPTVEVLMRKLAASLPLEMRGVWK
jgi:1-acyl-sn-glycerol-3-phosphate acyltransferase